MIDLSPTTLVHVIYFVQMTRACDFMGAVTRQPGGPWKLTYRFRYYADDRAHDSEDEKRWARLTVPAAEPEDLAQLADDMITEVLVPQRDRSLGEPTFHRVLVEGTGVDAIAALSHEPWAHMRVEGPAAGEA